MLEAFVHCHKHGIVFDRLRLTQIYFVREGTVKLRLPILPHLFGVELPRLYEIPYYQAPEVVLRGPGSSAVSIPASDVWSLGILLITLAEGAPPLYVFLSF